MEQLSYQNASFKTGTFYTPVRSNIRSMTMSPCGRGRGVIYKQLQEQLENVTMQKQELARPGSPEADCRMEDCAFCNRRCGNVICRNCGHVFRGRVRTKCVNHPGILHLMDYECCPNCTASQLQEFVSN